MRVRRETSLLFTTSDTFNGWDVSKVWEREHMRWVARSQLDRYADYTFPRLEESVYSKEFQYRPPFRPTICQELFWSYDGTSLLAVFNDTGIRQYLIPETNPNYDLDDTKRKDLNKPCLNSHTAMNELVPFRRFFKNKSIVSCEVHPRYSPYNVNPDENSILISSRDLPLQLYSLNLAEEEGTKGNHWVSRPFFSYDTVNEHNEQLLTPFSVQYLNSREFLTGSSRNTVRLYDRTRKQPLWTLSSTKAECGSSSTNKNIVSCFSELPSGKKRDLITNTPRYKLCGTYKGEVYLIDTRGTRASFSCIYRCRTRGPPGGGIYQLLESENEHYIYCVQRKSKVIDILDVRMGFKKINILGLPFTISQQKFKASISEYYGLTIGTPDGRLLTWSRDIVEFGGLDRNTGNDVKYSRPLPPDMEHTVKSVYPHNTERESKEEKGRQCRELRVNIVSYNPSDLGCVAISYSPDKRKGHELTEGNLVSHSGVSAHTLE